MNKIMFLSAFCATSILCGNSPALAKEPHSPKLHKYSESVYNNGVVMTVGDAIEKAIQASPRLRSSEAGIEAARGLEVQAGALPNPELEIGAENIAGGGQYSGTQSAEYSYGVSQTIEIGGKRSSRIGAAQAARNIANINLVVERLDIIRDVQIAYSEVLAEDEALKLAEEQQKLANEVLTTVSERVNAAREPEIQRSKAEVAYATSTIIREQEERKLKIAKDKLVNLWGESQLNASLDHTHFFDLDVPAPLETYQEKLDNTPDILKLAHIQAEKKSILSLEKSTAIPDPKINVGMKNFKESGDQAFMVGVSFPIPILNRNQGNVLRASSELTQAQNDGIQTKLTLQQQLIENWQNWYSSYSEAQRLKTKLLPAAEKAFTLARQGYQKGKFPYLEVLDAQRTLFDARAQYHEALKRYHAYRAGVERLTAANATILKSEGETK